MAAVLFILFAAAPSRAGIVPPAESPPIIVGGDHNLYPFEFLDSNGNPAGFNVDLTRAIAEVMGLKVEIRLGNWDLMRRGLADGSIDILEGMIYSEERAKQFDFSPPHTILYQSTFARKDAPQITRLEELAEKEVIVQRGDIMHDYLLENRVGAKLILVDTHADALRLLAAGHHDYALVDYFSGLYLGRKLGLSNIGPVPLSFSGLRYGYAVKKGDQALLANVAQGLAILRNTGKYQQIYDRWLEPIDPRDIPWSKIGLNLSLVAGPLLLVLAGIFAWNRALQREVARRSRELQVQQLKLIQADKMASLGILVAGVAHEINNPTGLILHNLPVLKKTYQTAEAVLESQFRRDGDFMIGGLPYSVMREETPQLFAQLQESANRIKRIVEDLKDFSRKEDLPLSDDIDLNTVVQAAIRLVDNSIKQATRRFSVDYAKNLPRFRGNGRRIEQVVVNLILNACHALQAVDQGIALRTRFDKPKRALILEVRDEGQGIASDHLPHLTDPFFTTKREQGGTGLGLSISAGIVAEHQGQLVFSSEPGAGTTVTLSVPIAKEGPAS
jgi:polar amino acid transport system substrate-binding protein